MPDEYDMNFIREQSKKISEMAAEYKRMGIQPKSEKPDYTKLIEENMDTYRELYLDKSDQLLKALTAAIDLQQENERLQKMIDNSSATVADCAMLVGAMRELCYEIEKCGASEQLTNTVILASEITNELKYITGGVAVEHRVHPTSEILRRLREVSTTKPDTDLKPGTSPLTCG